MTYTRLFAPVTGTGLAFHFYQPTASGAVDLGLAPIQTTELNHAPTLALISNQAVTLGSTVTFKASAIDPDAGQTLTYTLGPVPPSAEHRSHDRRLHLDTNRKSGGAGL